MASERDRFDLSDIARRTVWFRPPEETLKDRTFFLNHVMIHGLADDIVRTRRHFGDAAFRRALANAHPGIWDRRSWAFWHLVLDMGPPPPVPVRFANVDETLRGFGGPPKRWPVPHQCREDPATAHECRRLKSGVANSP